MCLHLSNHHISLLYTGTFQQNVSRRTSMSLLFSPLSRAASEAMTDIESSPKNSSISGGGGNSDNSGNDNNVNDNLPDNLPDVKRINDDDGNHNNVYNTTRRFPNDNEDNEDTITNNMKRLREQARGSSPSLSVSELMSNTKSKVDMFFSQQGESRVMYKSEDLRQDQLVVQMITLIDRIWKSVNLDLRLTPYRVLATGPDDGLVEFIEHTSTLTDVLKDFNQDVSLQLYIVYMYIYCIQISAIKLFKLKTCFTNMFYYYIYI